MNLNLRLHFNDATAKRVQYHGNCKMILVSETFQKSDILMAYFLGRSCILQASLCAEGYKRRKKTLNLLFTKIGMYIHLVYVKILTYYVHKCKMLPFTHVKGITCAVKCVKIAKFRQFLCACRPKIGTAMTIIY